MWNSSYRQKQRKQRESVMEGVRTVRECDGDGDCGCGSELNSKEWVEMHANGEQGNHVARGSMSQASAKR